MRNIVFRVTETLIRLVQRALLDDCMQNGKDKVIEYQA